MADQFANWNRFARHQALTQDPHRALGWTRHEIMVEKKRLKRLKTQATRLAAESAAKAAGKA